MWNVTALLSSLQSVILCEFIRLSQFTQFFHSTLSSFFSIKKMRLKNDLYLCVVIVCMCVCVVVCVCIYLLYFLQNKSLNICVFLDSSLVCLLIWLSVVANQASLLVSLTFFFSGGEVFLAHTILPSHALIFVG